MSRVNRQVLREEFDTLKKQFEDLCARGQMGTESRTLFQALLMLFELLMAVFMEKHTVKNSTNSSKPSSQTPPDESALGRPDAKGKGKVHNGVAAGNTRTVETVVVAEVAVCEGCGEDLSATSSAALRGAPASTSSSRRSSAMSAPKSSASPAVGAKPAAPSPPTCRALCSTDPGSRLMR